MLDSLPSQNDRLSATITSEASQNAIGGTFRLSAYRRPLAVTLLPARFYQEKKIFRIKIGRYSLKFDLAQFNSDLRALGKKSILNCQEVALLHDTEVPVRKCLSDNNFRRNSVFRRAKIVVAVGVACFQRRDRLGACSLSRRRDPRRRGTMLFDTSPRRFASPLGVESSQDEVASARVLEVASLVSPFPAIQECVFVSAVRTATLYEKACAIVPRSSYMLV